MKRSIAVVVVLVLSAVAGPAASAAPPPVTTLKVMTRNLYLGAELAPLFSADSFETFVRRAAAVWSTVEDTDFAERAEALADEIAAADPHVVGLQEVETWSTQTPSDLTGPNASDVRYDFLRLLLDGLQARGRSYAVASRVENFDVEAPMITASGLVDVRLQDSDAILVRADLPPSALSVSGHAEANYSIPLQLPTLTGSLTIRRGWNAVDLLVGGRAVRVVNTHLERLYGPLQEVEAAELLAGAASVPGRIVVLGDLNSAAAGEPVPGESDTATYAMMLAGGFVDAWSQKHGTDSGLTCCYAEDLRDAQELTERIDLVLMRGGVEAASVVRIGDEPAERTASGMWPSDHTGLVAVLRLR